MNIKVNRYKNPAITARTGFEGSIEPEVDTAGPGKTPSWILYWRPDGSAQLWTERAPTGHVIGTPIELKAGVLATLRAHGLMHESEPDAVCAYHSIANGEGCGTCARCDRLTPEASGISAPVADDALWVPSPAAEVTP